MGFGWLFSRILRDEEEREKVGESRDFFPPSWFCSTDRISWRRETARQKLSQGVKSNPPPLKSRRVLGLRKGLKAERLMGCGRKLLAQEG